MIRTARLLLLIGFVVALVQADAALAEGGEPPMTAKLYRIILPVGDIDKAETFYSALLEAPGERISPGRHYFNLGGAILALYDPKADGDPLGDGWAHHENQYMYIAVSDLDGALSRAKNVGADILSDIETMPWGERLFYFRDPFGNPVSFVDEKTMFTGAED